VKRIHCFSSLALAGLLCTGCWPMHVISSPGASGIVLDRQTRAAIGGAQVAVSRSWRRDWPNYGPPTLDEALADTRPPLVVTGADGHFFIMPEMKWIMEFPAPEGDASGTLVVRREGYKPAMVSLTDDSKMDVGTVLLTPVAGQQSRPQ
jgi:hypothetical protein